MREFDRRGYSADLIDTANRFMMGLLVLLVLLQEPVLVLTSVHLGTLAEVTAAFIAGGYILSRYYRWKQQKNESGGTHG